MQAFLLVFVASGFAQVVNTANGKLRGFVGEDNAFQFYGVPFAEPPVGELRWQPPQPVQSWDGVRDATEFSAACPQIFPANSSMPNNVTFSEDCLYLNIWTPTLYQQANLPVLFWIHGGSLTDGGSMELRSWGNYFSSQDIVVVTVGYRLGAIGFLALAELLAENASYPTTGNYGLLDQRAAMQWVAQNIANFGGDPSRITIAGESAGASSVCYHLVMPKSHGLFAQAILESSACFTEIAPLAQAEQTGLELARNAGCLSTGPDLLECMRSLSWQEIVAATTQDGNACIDGFEFTQHPYVSLKQKQFFQVPVLAGNCLNEGTAWGYGFSYPLNDTEYENYLLNVMFLGYETIGNQVLNEYPCSAYDASDCRVALSEVIGDFWLVCPTMLVQNAYEKIENVYSYIFAHHPSWVVQEYLGAYHSSEIQFVFNTLGIFNLPYTAQEQTLANQMSSYWLNFVKYSNPNSNSKLLHWPAYNHKHDRIVFNTTLSYEKNWKAELCDKFWNGIYEEAYTF